MEGVIIENRKELIIYCIDTKDKTVICTIFIPPQQDPHQPSEVTR